MQRYFTLIDYKETGVATTAEESHSYSWNESCALGYRQPEWRPYCLSFWRQSKRDQSGLSRAWIEQRQSENSEMKFRIARLAQRFLWRCNWTRVSGSGSSTSVEIPVQAKDLWSMRFTQMYTAFICAIGNGHGPSRSCTILTDSVRKFSYESDIKFLIRFVEGSYGKIHTISYYKISARSRKIVEYESYDIWASVRSYWFLYGIRSRFFHLGKLVSRDEQ